MKNHTFIYHLATVKIEKKRFLEGRFQCEKDNQRIINGMGKKNKIFKEEIWGSEKSFLMNFGWGEGKSIELPKKFCHVGPPKNNVGVSLSNHNLLHTNLD